MSFDYFRFEAVPESMGYNASIVPYGPSPMVQITFSVGGRKHQMIEMLPPESIMLGYLDHLVRKAVEAFRESIEKDKREQENKRARNKLTADISTAVDNYERNKKR